METVIIEAQVSITITIMVMDPLVILINIYTGGVVAMVDIGINTNNLNLTENLK